MYVDFWKVSQIAKFVFLCFLLDLVLFTADLLDSKSLPLINNVDFSEPKLKQTRFTTPTPLL